MGDSATGDSLLWSSSSGVGSSETPLSKDVREDMDSHMFVEALDVALETVLDESIFLVLEVLVLSPGPCGLPVCACTFDDT